MLMIVSIKFLPLLIIKLIIVKVFSNFDNLLNMHQLKLFDYRKDYLFEKNNEIAHYYDILSENENSISYSEHIDPKEKFSICGMDYEEYVDIKKSDQKQLNYDKIYNFLINLDKDKRLEGYKNLLRSMNIKYESDLFTWNSDY